MAKVNFWMAEAVGYTLRFSLSLRSGVSLTRRNAGNFPGLNLPGITHDLLALIQTPFYEELYLEILKVIWLFHASSRLL